MSFRQDLRFAARSLRRHPGFTAVALISLAAGIGLNAVVFGVINTIFFQTVRGVPAAERLAFVGARTSYPAYQHLRDGTRTLRGLAAWDMTQADVRWGTVAKRHTAPAVSGEYFTALGVRPALGRFFAPDDAERPRAEPVAVLDDAFWREIGSPADVVGRAVVVNGVPLTVVGVAPPEFHGIGPERPPLWVPLGMLPALEKRPEAWADTAARRWRLVGRVRDGVPVAQARAELRVLAAREPALFGAEPLVVDDGRESIAADSPEKHVEFLLVTVVPLAVVAVILWIGCSNVANLLLARAVHRRREIVVRVANGASRWRLVRMLLTESLLLAALGGAVGLLAASWAVRLVWATFPEFSSIALELDGRVAAYTALVSVVSTLVFGLAPALHATRVDVAPTLTAAGTTPRTAPGGSRLRTFFLVTQIASSVVLLVVASTFVRTLVSTHVGEQSATIDRLVIAQVASGRASPAARAAFWRQARETVAALPGVTAVSLLPAAGAESRARLTGAGAAPLDVVVQGVDSAFFRAMGHPVLAGRGIADVAARDAVVLNEDAARRLRSGGRPPLGTVLTLGDSAPVEIAGVVRDGATAPRVYRPLDDASFGDANVLVRTAGPPAPMTRPVRAALARLAPDPAFTRAETFRDAAVGPLRRLTRAVTALGILALALAAIGLYGSIAFFTAQRTREIAVRLAVGAPRVRVLRLLLAYGLRVVGAGSALGLVLTAVAFRFMGGLIFGRWTLDLPALAIVAVTLGATTLAACYVPGRRAMRVDPMRVLRAE